jgi:hypothetical protein
MCCTDAQGCGVVTPDWMVNVNATFIGTTNVAQPGYTGPANEWQANGVQPNYWLQTPDARAAPVGLFQVPDDYQFFNPASYEVGAQPDDLFTVPSYCLPNCPPVSICTVA